jgi:hypothetical protein
MPLPPSRKLEGPGVLKYKQSNTAETAQHQRLTKPQQLRPSRGKPTRSEPGKIGHNGVWQVCPTPPLSLTKTSTFYSVGL